MCFTVTCQRYALLGLELDERYFDFIVHIPNICYDKNI